MHYFLLLFITVPLAEIYLLIAVGRIINVWPTIGLIIFTAVLGTWLLRLQGIATLQKVRQSLAHGQIPAEAIVEGLVLLFAGALLLTPGFITDAVGFACLIPAVRRYFAHRLKQRLVPGGVAYTATSPGPVVMDGEFRREEDYPDKRIK